MRKLLLLASVLFITFGAVAQENEVKRSAFQLSFFPPLGTNGHESGKYTNDVSLNLLVGLSANEKAFTLGGLANIIKEDASMVQIAGLVNYIGRDQRGLLMSGLANYAGGDMKGAQFSGLANIGGQDFVGVQMAGLANVVCGNVKGAQFSGLANIDGKDFEGVQMAGLANYANDVKGCQMSSLLNIADTVEGCQISSYVNVARNVDGCMVGIVNVASHCDYPIGFLNFIADGEKSIGLSYDAMGNAMLSFRSGGRVTYGIVGVGVNPILDLDMIVRMAGYGVKIKALSWLQIRGELTASVLVLGFPLLLRPWAASYSCKVLPEVLISDHFGIYAGAGCNYMHAPDDSAISPGFHFDYMAGIEYIF